MKHRAWLLVPLAAAWATGCGAQAVHKCVGIGDGGVAYQNAPCSGAQVDAGFVRLPGYADPPQRDGAMSPPAEAPQATAPADTPDPPANLSSQPDSQEAFPYRTSIALGMTDDQVLNIANWGRPTRIVRAGRHHGWRETWIYDRDAEAARELSFVDGRLTSIDVGTTSLRLATAAR